MQVQEKAKEISDLLARLISAGGIKLTAHYECIGRRMECKIDPSWKFHGAEIKQESLSFIAQKDGQLPIRFLVNAEHYEAFLRWLKQIEKSILFLVQGVMAVVEETIVFLAGVVELKKEAVKTA
jgi:hypothetical protein